MEAAAGGKRMASLAYCHPLVAASCTGLRDVQASGRLVDPYAVALKSCTPGKPMSGRVPGPEDYH